MNDGEFRCSGECEAAIGVLVSVRLQSMQLEVGTFKCLVIAAATVPAGDVPWGAMLQQQVRSGVPVTVHTVVGNFPAFGD